MIIRFLHILMASFLMLAQSGILVHHHYCQDQWMDSSLFIPPPSCHEKDKDQGKKPCPFHGNSTDKKDCCDDRSTYVESEVQSTFIGISEIPDLNPEKISLVICMEPTGPVEQWNHVKKGFCIHDPPPLIRQHLSWLQNFRC